MHSHIANTAALSCLAVGVTFLQGCMGSDGSTAASQDLGTSTRAHVQERMLDVRPTRHCHVDVSFLQVTTGSPTVDASINQQLELTAEALLEGDCSQGSHEVFGKQALVYNDLGVLVVRHHLIAVNNSVGSDKIASFVFDLGTGRRLFLNDVLNADGVKQLQSECERVYKRYMNDGIDGVTNTDACFSSVEMSLDAGGIFTLQPKAPYRIIYASAYIQGLEWTAILPTIIHPNVRAIAARAEE